MCFLSTAHTAVCDAQSPALGRCHIKKHLLTYNIPLYSQQTGHFNTVDEEIYSSYNRKLSSESLPEFQERSVTLLEEAKTFTVTLCSHQ